MCSRDRGERTGGQEHCFHFELTLPYGFFVCKKREEERCLGARNLETKVARVIISLKQSKGAVNMGGITEIISLHLKIQSVYPSHIHSLKRRPHLVLGSLVTRLFESL